MNKRIKIISGIVVLGCICIGSIFVINTKQSKTTDKVDQVNEIKMNNGWNEVGNDKYYYEDNVMKTGWLKEDGKSYYFGEDGKMKTGWVRDDNHWYYMSDDGTMSVNTIVYGCYLNENGIMEESSKQEEIVVDNSALKDIQYTRYTNSKYGFSIDYPMDFMKTDSPEGVSFTRNDGLVSITVNGVKSDLSKSIGNHYNSTLKNITVPISYKALKKDSYVISWSDNGQIKYIYSKLGADFMNTFIIIYPESERDKYDDMVEHIYATFKTQEIN